MQLQTKTLTETEAACRQALLSNPGDSKVHLDLAEVLKAQNLPMAALAEYTEAIQCAPDAAMGYIARGVLFAEMNGFEEALADLRRAIELAPVEIAGHLAMIQTLQAKEDFAAAEQYCREALQLHPQSARVWEQLGIILQTVGRFSESADCLRKSLKIKPSGFVSMVLSRMPGEIQAGDEPGIRELWENPDLPPRDRAAAGFALGDLLDKADRFDEAFSTYASANLIFKEFSARQGEYFDGDDLRQKVDWMIETITPDFFKTRSDFGQSSELPVFIVGMPRSGTSLVEQIVASHSQVFGAGERPDIANIRARLTEMKLEDSPRHWQRHWHRHLAKVHLGRLALLGGDAVRVTDKMPANILHLGLIATLFPGARVIFCQRDPRATCLSCYFQLFQQHKLMFSYDLVDCAWQHREQDRLTAHWQKVLPLRMLSVGYEDLVRSPEIQARRLIEFLGLDWQPQCLDFYHTSRPVRTKSVWQVRQPVYTRSIARWEHYARYLPPQVTESFIRGNAVDR